jgi:hypothetical protein
MPRVDGACLTPGFRSCELAVGGSNSLPTKLTSRTQKYSADGLAEATGWDWRADGRYLTQAARCISVGRGGENVPDSLDPPL